MTDLPLTVQQGYSLNDIFAALASSSNFAEMLEIIVRTAVREMHADQGSLLLLEGTGDSAQLRMLAAVGLPAAIVERGYVPRRGSISEYVMRERRPLIINGAARGGEFHSLSDDTAVRRRIHSALCVPLVSQGRVLGTLNLNRTRTTDHFTDADLEAGFIVASQAAMVIENARLQGELAQQQRLAVVGQTVAGISHCIKNILTGVNGGLAVTEMGLANSQPEVVHEGFGVLKRSVGMLQNLVLDLLDYSREREPVREEFDVAQVLAAVEDALGFRARSAGVELRVTAEQEHLPFRGDRDQVFRALMNLTLNAVEAFAAADTSGDTQAKVRVYARRLGQGEFPPVPAARCADAAGWLEILVEDNGPGIPEDRQDAVWEMFHSTKGSRGTGIGLAVSRKMVEEHRGVITLESAAGCGCVFRVHLPVVGVHAADATA